jgi:ferredoxin-NADP reductase/DMSO/TMAO reductase YedYZ heme-binding membrane subunit
VPIASDGAFHKALVIVNGVIPFALMLFDAFGHRLGVDPVKAALHATGMLGFVFLLLSLAVTPIRRLTGWSRVVGVRRALGLYAFFYLSAHLVIFYVFDRAFSLPSTVHEILTRRYLQIGTAGYALLIPLAVTSTDAMVTRLGARRWKTLHRVVYLATALGSLHYYLLVKADLRQPLALAGVLALFLGYRVVQSGLDARSARRRAALRPWSGELRIQRIVQETSDVKTFRLVASDGGRLPFVHQPGQYLNLTLTIDGERVGRSYTIASPPTRREYCEVTIKRVGNGRASPYMHDALAEGSLIKVSAPAGRFVFTGAEADAVVLLAGGVGITPLMAILRYLTDRKWKGHIHLIFAARTRADVIFFEELGRLRGMFENLHVILILSNEDDPTWTGARGRISSKFLSEAVPRLTEPPIYLCGPDGMMQAARTLLGELGVPEPHIKTEVFVSPGAMRGPRAPRMLEVFAGTATVEFRRSMQMVEIPPDQTLLEAAEDVGIKIPFECRSGICGQCKTRLLEGRVSMEVQDALNPTDRSQGVILACQAHAATASLVVDA